jgi:hypothetical protein
MIDNKVVINLKPSARVVNRFKAKFPNATFYGNTTLGSKSKSYLLPLHEYEANKELIKQYGTKARYQPFINN